MPTIVEMTHAIEQVKDGEQYKGTVTFSGDPRRKFTYELEFKISIPRLDDGELPTDMESLRRIFIITVFDCAGKEQVLDDYMWQFFFQLCVVEALNFYNQPQTRSHNESTALSALPALLPGASVTLGIESKKSLRLDQIAMHMIQSIVGHLP